MEIKKTRIRISEPEAIFIQLNILGPWLRKDCKYCKMKKKVKHMLNSRIKN